MKDGLGVDGKASTHTETPPDHVVGEVEIVTGTDDGDGDDAVTRVDAMIHTLGERTLPLPSSPPYSTTPPCLHWSAHTVPRMPSECSRHTHRMRRSRRHNVFELFTR